MESSRLKDFSKTNWKELRHDGKWCDGVIRLAGYDEKFHVHRTILSSAGHFFKTGFLYALDSEITLDISPEILNLILDFIYTGECKISHDVVEELLKQADFLGYVELVRSCAKFLISEIDVSNGIGIFRFGQWYCGEVERKAKTFVLENFMGIVEHSEELVELPADDLMQLLSDEALNVSEEDILLSVIKNWIEYDQEGRVDYLPRLFSNVRYGLLTNGDAVKAFLAWEPVTKIPKCVKALNEAVERIKNFRLNTTRNQVGNIPIEYQSRLPYDMIFVVGGWSYGSTVKSCEIYDSRASSWLRFLNEDAQRSYHGICAIDHKLYVIGGFDGLNKYHNSVRCYDTRVHTWEEKACMNTPRCYVCIVVHDGFIYAIGGFDGHMRLDSIERYSPSKNQWELVAKMHSRRSDAAAVVLNDEIYVAGGFSGSEIMASCEVYNIKSDKWKFVRPMETARSGLELVACKGEIYALGGFDGHRRLTSMEKIPRDCRWWTGVKDMMSPRSNFAAVTINDIIYAVGGFDGVFPICATERYCPETDEWNASPQLQIPRSAHAACVMVGFENIKNCLVFCKECIKPLCSSSPKTSVNTARRMGDPYFMYGENHELNDEEEDDDDDEEMYISDEEAAIIDVINN